MRGKAASTVYSRLARVFESSPNVVVTHRELVIRLYGWAPFHGKFSKSSLAYVRVAVMEVRKLLTMKGTIRTVKGVGYKFIPKEGV